MDVGLRRVHPFTLAVIVFAVARRSRLMLVEDEREGVRVVECAAVHAPDPRHHVDPGWKALLYGQVP